jgi:hypothetical protein
MAPTRCKFVLFLFLLVSVYAPTQTGNGIAATAVTVGAPLGTEQQGGNTLLVGTTVATSYDDNALNSKPEVQNLLTTLYTQVGVNITRARWLATLSWITGVSYNSANIPQNNFLSQSLGGTWLYRSTQRLNFEVRDSFSYSTNPFDALRNSAVLPQFGTLNTPTYITWNNIPKIIEVAGATVTYAASPQTNAYVDLGYEYLGYQNLRGANGMTSPLHSQSGGMAIGLSKQISQRYSTGLQYSLQYLDYDSGQVRTTAQSLEYLLTVALKRSMSISGIIGPQYLQSTVNSLGGVAGGSGLPKTNSWSWVGGITFDWTGRHNGLGASVIREVNTGVGLEANVQQLVANVQLHREFTKRFSAYLFTNYTTNQPLVGRGIFAASANSYLSAGAGLTRDFTNRLTFGATYWIIRQGKPGPQNLLYAGDHNRFAFSLSYQLIRPLRRH